MKQDYLTYENEIKQHGIELNTPESECFANEKRNSYIKDTFLNKLNYIRKIVWDESLNVFIYNDGRKRLVKENYFIYSGNTLVTKTRKYTLRGSDEAFNIAKTVNNKLRKQDCYAKNCPQHLLQ